VCSPVITAAVCHKKINGSRSLRSSGNNWAPWPRRLQKGQVGPSSDNNGRIGHSSRMVGRAAQPEDRRNRTGHAHVAQWTIGRAARNAESADAVVHAPHQVVASVRLVEWAIEWRPARRPRGKHTLLHLGPRRMHPARRR
jgi:hypothetical protein